MDDRDDRGDTGLGDPTEGYDPVSHQLAAIQTRLDRIEVAVTLRNARHRQRATRAPLRILFFFGFGLVVGAFVAVLLMRLSTSGS